MGIEMRSVVVNADSGYEARIARPRCIACKHIYSFAGDWTPHAAAFGCVECGEVGTVLEPRDLKEEARARSEFEDAIAEHEAIVSRPRVLTHRMWHK